MLSTVVSTRFAFPLSSFSPLGSSMYSVFVPKTISTGMKRQYLFKIPSRRDFSENSVESSAMCNTISVPKVSFSTVSMVKFGEPSHTHLTADASFLDFEIISTSFATINAE